MKYIVWKKIIFEFNIFEIPGREIPFREISGPEVNRKLKFWNLKVRWFDFSEFILAPKVAKFDPDIKIFAVKITFLELKLHCDLRLLNNKNDFNLTFKFHKVRYNR